MFVFSIATCRFNFNFAMPRTTARATALLLLSFAVLKPVSAQSPAPAAAPAPPSAPTTGPAAPLGAPLTLTECIALAMKKNFDLQIQGFSTDIARENLVSAKAAFLPTITASSQRDLSRGTRAVGQNDGSVLLIPSDSNNTVFNAGISERIQETNGTVSIGGRVSRASSSQRQPFSSSTTFSVNQPLLKNAGPTIATATIERSKLGLGIAYINYRSRVLTVIRDTENAYYNLVAARETLRIRQLTLDLNEKLFEENKTKRTTGVMTDLDVLTAEYGVANARRAVVQAEQTASDREDTLLNLINVPNFESRPGPVSFEVYKADPISFATSYKMARENYPDTMSAEQTIKQLEIDLATAKRNRLPTLNLTASLGYNTADTTYGDVLTVRPNDAGDNRSLGLTFNMPWGMKADRSAYRTATLNRDSQKVRLEQLELSLLVQVRTAVRSVEANAVAVSLAVKATELSARQYDLQKARFDAGLSTSRLVLQAQDDLETARFNELSANLTLRGALAELQRLEGSSIKRFGVQLPE